MISEGYDQMGEMKDAPYTAINMHIIISDGKTMEFIIEMASAIFSKDKQVIEIRNNGLLPAIFWMKMRPIMTNTN
jgi:hypothetical protein